MSLSQDLENEIKKGMHDYSNSIPIGYDRICDELEIAKNTYYVIGGETGVGKSTFAHEAFCINPIEWYLKNKTDNIKLSVIGFFMERRQVFYTARWVSRMLFQEQGLSMSPDKILRKKGEIRMTPGEHEIVKKYYKVFDEWEGDDILKIYESSKNPTGISMFLELFAERHGKIHKKDKKAEKTMDNVLESPIIFEPNHPNHIVLVITDNLSSLAPEGDGKAKTLVDKHSRTMREARDYYGMSPVVIQHLNRSLSDIHRQKSGDLIPKLSDFSTSSQTQNDADIVAVLFNPYNHAKTEENYMGFDLRKLKEEYKTYYRSFHLLKNSFGSVGMGYPLAIHEQYGILKILPKSKNMTDEIYNDVKSGKYFLPSDIEREERIIMKPFAGFGNHVKTTV